MATTKKICSKYTFKVLRFSYFDLFFRHNFSAYFYMLYLTVEEEDIGINLLTFVPQMLLLLALAKKFGNLHDLPFCLFCQTHVFVVYNKVCTAKLHLKHVSALSLLFSNSFQYNLFYSVI